MKKVREEFAKAFLEQHQVPAPFDLLTCAGDKHFLRRASILMPTTWSSTGRI